MISLLKKLYDAYLISNQKREIQKVRDYERSKHSNSLTGLMANELIFNWIKGGKSFAAGKIGTTELSCLNIEQELNGDGKWDRMKMRGGRYYGGIYPDTPDLFEKFSKVYFDSLHGLDLVGLWYNRGEYDVINRLNSEPEVVDGIQFLEPFYINPPWSSALLGKRVLVIHPFEASIRAQYSIRKRIWPKINVLPDFELLTLKVPQNAGVQTPLFPDWLQTLDYLKNEVDKLEFDVALIGAGGWSIPLASHVKGSGKIGIHIGGGLQVLFGIKGGRWEGHSKITQHFNENWINVLAEDLPDKVGNVSLIPKKDQYW